MNSTDEDIEVVDGLPVLAEPADERSAMDHARPAPAALAAVPKRHVLALVAGSFAAGAATMLLSAKHRQVKVTARPRRPSLPDIIGSDRYLIDVHTLRR